MTDELFTIPESLSPKRKWINEHAIVIVPGYDNTWEDGEIYPFMATIPGHDEYFGGTEDEALIRLANALNIPLWT